MYVDLVRAYLPAYGSQARLAQALRVSQAFLSYLLATPGGRDQPWHKTLDLPKRELTEYLKQAKVPSTTRAREIANQLCTDRERRSVLMHYARLAQSRADAATAPAWLDLGTTNEAIIALGNIHAVALKSTDPEATRRAYRQVWAIGMGFDERIDPRQQVAAYVQVRMFLHDAASVLDRHDLALGHARRAVFALAMAPAPDVGLDRLRINALLAECVALNNLGLWRDALMLSRRAMSARGIGDEPDQWQRSFLEQQLTAFIGSPRIAIYEAENAADRACSLVPDSPVLQAGVTVRLARAHLARASARDLRNAGRLVSALERVIVSEASLTPLRRMQVLRAFIEHARATGDRTAEAHHRTQARDLAAAANLPHQRRLA